QATFNRPPSSTASAARTVSVCLAIATGAPGGKTAPPKATGPCQPLLLLTSSQATFNRPPSSTASAARTVSVCLAIATGTPGGKTATPKDTGPCQPTAELFQSRSRFVASNA